MANQLLGKRAIRYVLEELARDPEFDFYALADPEANVAQLAAAARDSKIGRPLQLLVEGGLVGGRTGARDLKTALGVARAIKAAEPYLALRGVEGYEGIARGTDDADTNRKCATSWISWRRSPLPARRKSFSRRAPCC